MGRQPPRTAWKKGQSGNPNGKPKKNTEVTDLARAECVDAFFRIVDISKETTDEKLRLEANKYIIDRAIGKPHQSMHHGDHEGGPLQISVVVREKLLDG